jgi:hypothetical protein
MLEQFLKLRNIGPVINCGKSNSTRYPTHQTKAAETVILSYVHRPLLLLGGDDV